jgi:hypothetical protein
MLQIMNVLRLSPVIFSLLLLGAHFYRAGQVVLTGLCLAVLFLLFLRKSWVPKVFQLLLVAGSLEWLRSLYSFAAMRIAWDQPWARLAIILGAVALFTVLSGLVFQHQKLKVHYQPESR